MSSNFVHLHCHSEYSLLDGMIKIPELCAKANEFGMNACAITDHGNIFGAAYFYKTCKDAGINPIIGSEVYVCADRFAKNTTDKHRNHLILLAQNNQGYHNLCQISSLSYTEGFYYVPRVDHNLLREHNDGIICLSACIIGEIPEAILAGNMDRAVALAEEYHTLFPDRFYLELQSNGLKEQEVVNTGLKELAEQLHLPLVATNDCHYLRKTDYDAHEVLLCIGTKKLLKDEDRLSFTTNEFYYKSPEEMEAAFADLPEAIANTALIAESCHVELDMGHHYFPVYPLPEGASIESEFRRLAEEGLEHRLERHPKRESLDFDVYRARLQHEIKVILDMGFPGYFLIVQEFINWAKDHGIPVGPGRGSAAGSLVAWAMQITNIDPIPYNLLFERFLNSERVSLPDIDVDFSQKMRAEVIQHLRDTYGADRVTQIVTFGTLKARAVIRDVARVLEYPYMEADSLAKAVPPKYTLSQAISDVPEVQMRYSNDPATRALLDTALHLEDLHRNVSTHASGVVIAHVPTVEFAPVCVDANNKSIIRVQYDGPMAELIGMVKFDILGLKTLDVINRTIANIIEEGKPTPDMDCLPLDDARVYALYAQGETDGIFQVESPGLRKYLRMLIPTTFEDLIAMLALYRPGPLGSGMVDSFIHRKHGQEPVEYYGLDEILEPILAPTYGVIVYQEQVMQIAQAMAGYTLGGADILRRAMGKKKPEEMAKQRTVFLEGCRKNGIVDDKANEIFNLMEKFAAYGFNKSHSAAYALISYQTAYLRVYYPAEFLAATMSLADSDKLPGYISAAQSSGIEIAPPDINVSRNVFYAHAGRIFYAVSAIKGVGEKTVANIIAARDTAPFRSLRDLYVRTSRMTQPILTRLIEAGACDCFAESRARMAAAVPTVADKRATASSDGIGVVFNDFIPDWDDNERLAREKMILGVYVTGNPAAICVEEICRQGWWTLESAQKFGGNSAPIRCALIVQGGREWKVKKEGKNQGKSMCKIHVMDMTGNATLTCFPAQYDRYKNLIKMKEPLVFDLDCRQGDRKVEEEIADENGEMATVVSNVREMEYIVRDVRSFDDACKFSNAPVAIHVPYGYLDKTHTDVLNEILARHCGPCSVQLYVQMMDCRCVVQAQGVHVQPSLQFYRDIRGWWRS